MINEIIQINKDKRMYFFKMNVPVLKLNLEGQPREKRNFEGSSMKNARSHRTLHPWCYTWKQNTFSKDFFRSWLSEHITLSFRGARVRPQAWILRGAEPENINFGGILFSDCRRHFVVFPASPGKMVNNSDQPVGRKGVETQFRPQYFYDPLFTAPWSIHSMQPGGVSRVKYPASKLVGSILATCFPDAYNGRREGILPQVTSLTCFPFVADSINSALSSVYLKWV